MNKVRNNAVCPPPAPKASEDAWMRIHTEEQGKATVVTCGDNDDVVAVP